MTFQSDRPTGRGAQALKQILESLIRKQGNKSYSGLEYATANTQDSITLDRDGFAIYSAEGDFFTLEHVQFEAGDRLVVTTINGPRGAVLVLGRWQKSTLIAARREHPIRVVDEVGISTTNPTPDNISEKIQLSRGWLFPHSRIRVIGKVDDSQGAGSRITFSVTDATAGSLVSVVLSDGASFDESFAWDDISDDDFNTLEFKIVYDDPTNGTGKLKECVLLIGDP